ncbi:ABC transporter, permease protein [Treponema socranskii subsp. socranskii VPI DR56BR1116 = ATCC 35536]|uniref:ABC transporter, permease protein n=1 Tax=Treponema socranskii subsp. socranskii VPI DR56BR1116 = ATCC 35536 TaxID=1125725 RepID=U1GP26_TRESO|nr:iron ABC transporter permease [Treponema socranskii]ERF59755.1 ABC transporter, permease protein [Treponema socranskii subsp. socranskii VPI DR56BR1116 = ATCC 35536]ERK04390.1 ABC transporter, permease protein [Treponema socranskii subsp. socranskii VPI DR56BR1116 = ATCC 35536]
MLKTKKTDLWILVSLGILALYVLFMLYPILKVITQSVRDNATGSFTLGYFKQFFSDPYYFITLFNSFKISICVTVICLVIGVPLAYLYNIYEIKGRQLLQILIVLTSMSAPFIGAYSWILLLGRSGLITKFLKSTFNIAMPNIYGFKGILLVLSTKLFSLVFLYVSGALKNVDNSLLEASANMGRTGWRRFLTIVLPLCMPSILAAALMVFMRSLADFGTPLLIGEGYRTFPVEIYNQYVGETSINHSFAAAISVIAIVITLIVFLFQKYLSNRTSFSMNAMHRIERKKPRLLASIAIHIYAYGLVIVSLLPQVYLVFLSFRNTTKTGNMFRSGYSLMSYRQVFGTMGGAIWNTVKICGGALVIVVVLAILISYLVVRRYNIINNIIDTLSMVPYIIPGSVVGIAMVMAFNKGPLVLTGTAMIMVIAMCIRRIPYTIRSSVAVLGQIPISVEEAAISLGAGKTKTLVRITVPMMFSGIVSGAIMSWVTLITELSSSIILYSSKTITLNLGVYVMVSRGTDGKACAVSTILMVFTVISLLLFTKVSKDGDISI